MGAIAVFGSKAEAVRRVITAKGGQTAIDGIRSMRPKKKNVADDENLMEKLVGFNVTDVYDLTTKALGDFKGWITSGLQTILSNFNVTGIYGLFVAGAVALYYFNWNISDDELEQAIKARERQWYGQLGETVGHMVGWALGGVLPGLVIGTFNESMMVHVLQDVGEEMFDELSSDLGNLLQLAARNWMLEKANRLFMGTRAMIKRAAAGEADTLAGGAFVLFFNKFPKLKEAVKNWGSKESKPWSFNSAMTEWVESFPEGNFKEFLEEFLEALGESLIEAGYVVAGGIDSYIALNKVNQTQIQGKQAVVDVLLDRSDPGSRVIVAGTEQQVMQQLIGLKNNHQLLKQHDMGITLDGKDLEQQIYTKKTEINNVMIKIRMFSNKTQPFWKGSKDKTKRFQKTEITVPTVERSKLDWDKIVLAIGGQNGFFYGSHELTGFLVDSLGRNRGKIVVSAHTEDEAGDRIEALADLADCKVSNFVRGGQVKRGDQGRLLYVEPIKVFPGDVTIINAKKITDKKEGRREQAGNYKRTSTKLDLSLGKQPDNWLTEINALFTND